MKKMIVSLLLLVGGVTMAHGANRPNNYASQGNGFSPVGLLCAVLPGVPCPAPAPGPGPIAPPAPHVTK